MEYRVEVVADASGEWCGNGITFETPEKAAEYARDLFGRWTAVRRWRVLDAAGIAIEEGA